VRVGVAAALSGLKMRLKPPSGDAAALPPALPRLNIVFYGTARGRQRGNTAVQRMRGWIGDERRALLSSHHLQ
jgi:hypothetical protein